MLGRTGELGSDKNHSQYLLIRMQYKKVSSAIVSRNNIISALLVLTVQIAMDPYSFNALVAEVKKTPFADRKVDAVRTSLVGGGQITSEQVAQLVKLIPFSSDQLKVATLAYTFAIDKASYGRVVGDAFFHKR